MNTANEHIVPIELITKFLAGECSQQERSRLESWLKLSAENQKEFDAFAKLWQYTGENYQHDDINVDREWQRMQQTISPREGRMVNMKRFLQLAASVIVIFGISFLILKQTQTITIKSGTSQLTNLSLPDGSVISLNAHSKITYKKDFNKENRHINLSGEAYFEVAHNIALPFIVNATGTQVEVVGTKFNIRAYKRQAVVKVTVIEGIVKLSEADRPIQKTIVRAGETGTFTREESQLHLEQNVEINDISWKTRVLVFDNWHLSDVANVLQNTYQIDFEVADILRECKVTVEFRNKDLDSVLQVLGSTLDLKIRKTDGKIIITGSGC